MITKAHIIKLYPTKNQEMFFNKSCGIARFSYNWALSKWKELYESGQKTSAYDLIKLQNGIKKKEFTWMGEVGKCSPQYAIHNVEIAFKNFFKKQANYPKFKKKGKKDSFVAIERKKSFKQQNNKIWIPRLGWVKCAENLRFEGKVNNVIVKRIADMWFAVINIQTTDEAKTICESQAIVGVDLGVKSLAVCSDGQVFENPKALKKSLKSLKRQQRSLCRKEKGSSNRKKQQIKVARLHYRISCVRKNSLHNATTKIVNGASVIVIEDLNVKGMIRNRNLSQSISDSSFGEFRRQLQYKAEWQGKKVIVADRFFASSKTCSCCGWKNENLKLSDRIFSCASCNLKIDRDLNASLNLKKYGTAKLVETAQEKCKAYGEGSSVMETLHSHSMKQEIIN